MQSAISSQQPAISNQQWSCLESEKQTTFIPSLGLEVSVGVGRVGNKEVVEIVLCWARVPKIFCNVI